MIKNQRLRNLIGWIQLPWLIIKIRKWDLDRLIKVHAGFARIARDHPHRRKEGSFMAFKRAVARRMVIECKKDKNKVAFTLFRLNMDKRMMKISKEDKTR